MRPNSPPLPLITAALSLTLLTLALPDAAAEPAPAAPAPAAPAPARTGKYCLEQPDAKFILSQTIGLQLNPLGAENQMALSICVPFTRVPGALFDFTNLELGLVNYLSPVYDHQGAFVSVAPLSILKLRAEVTGFGIWPIPLDGGGYFTHDSYAANFQKSAHPHNKADSAAGSVVAFSAALQGKVPLSRGAAVLAIDTLLAELWTVGSGPFWYNSRRDALLARSDWVIKNTAFAVVEIPLTENINIRAGLADDATFIPAAGYTTNIVAGLTTLVIKRVGKTIRNFQPFLRAGIYTEHASASGFRTGEGHLLAGINTSYDLGTIESAPEDPQIGVALTAIP